jgi:hypothetical protein
LEIELVGGGRCTRSCFIDPLLTTLIINTGHSVVQTFSDIPKTEHFITVTNGDPGLKAVAIRVNGKDFKRFRFDGLTRAAPIINIDAGAVMTQDKNTLTFIGLGEVGSLANILVGDAAPPAASTVGSRFLGSVAGKAQDAGVWGPLVDSVEDNASDQSAIASTQEVHLNLATSLDQRSAADASRYAVTVKGSPVLGARVAASPGTDGTALVLTLPAKSFVPGDAITVNWTALKTAKGQPLSGHVDLITE